MWEKSKFGIGDEMEVNIEAIKNYARNRIRQIEKERDEARCLLGTAVNYPAQLRIFELERILDWINTNENSPTILFSESEGWTP